MPYAAETTQALHMPRHPKAEVKFLALFLAGGSFTTE